MCAWMNKSFVLYGLMLHMWELFMKMRGFYHRSWKFHRSQAQNRVLHIPQNRAWSFSTGWFFCAGVFPLRLYCEHLRRNQNMMCKLIWFHNLYDIVVVYVVIIVKIGFSTIFYTAQCDMVDAFNKIKHLQNVGLATWYL